MKALKLIIILGAFVVSCANPVELTDIEKLKVIKDDYTSELNYTTLFIRESERDSKIYIMAKNIGGESFGPVFITTDGNCKVKSITKDEDVIKPFDVPREAIRKIIPDLCALKISVIRCDSLGNIFVGIDEVSKYEYVYLTDSLMKTQKSRYSYLQNDWYKIN